jgi:hypothetical protein
LYLCHWEAKSSKEKRIGGGVLVIATESNPPLFWHSPTLKDDLYTKSDRECTGACEAVRAINLSAENGQLLVGIGE